MIEYYRIAGIKIKITGVALPERGSLQPFACEHFEKPDATITLVSKPASTKTEYSYSDRGVNWARLDGGSRYFCFFLEKDTIISDALISPDWSEIEVYFNRSVGNKEYFMKPTMEALFYNICLLHNSIPLHSAAVDWRGNGILFSAPSGTGKSTQADLWVNNYGAEYINGDRPLLKLDGEELYVCGTAWSGSAEIYKNVYIPLAALVFVEQFPENKIYPLDNAEALKRVLPRCFLPYNDREMMSLAMDIIDTIIARAACWRLLCTPDIGAAELVKKCITENRKFKE